MVRSIFGRWKVYVEHCGRTTNESVLEACTIGPPFFRELDVSRWSLPARDNRNCLGTLRHRTAAVSGSQSVVRLNVADQKIQRGRNMKRHKSALLFRALDGSDWAGERSPSPGGESKTNHQERRCRHSGARHGYALFGHRCNACVRIMRNNVVGTAINRSRVNPKNATAETKLAITKGRVNASRSCCSGVSPGIDDTASGARVIASSPATHSNARISEPKRSCEKRTIGRNKTAATK